MKNLHKVIKITVIVLTTALSLTACTQETDSSSVSTTTSQINHQITATIQENSEQNTSTLSAGENLGNTQGEMVPPIDISAPAGERPISPPGNPPGNQSGMSQPPSGSPPGTLTNDTGTVGNTGNAFYTLSGGSENKSGESITVTDDDTSAIKVTNGGNLTLYDMSIKTSGNTSSMDNSSFYGLNAAVLATSGGQATIKGGTIETTGTGANGVFSTGEGTVITLEGVTIVCSASGAHGVDATYGGTLNLTDVDITTAGNGAAAAIATDRGGGTIYVTGGTAKTTGTRSPGIYSTGSITAVGGTYSAMNSEAAVIEGKNTITLTDATLYGAKSWGVLIYQSFSGDAEVGVGTFNMSGGSLTNLEGPAFYITNTEAVINLQNVELNTQSGILINAAAGQWGNTGSNGGIVTLKADNQILGGDITCDQISSISIILKNNSRLSGAINKENSGGIVSVSLDATSVWNVTANSYITVFSDEDTTLANIKDNGNTIYYDASNSANSWLNGAIYTLPNGGMLIPF